MYLAPQSSAPYTQRAEHGYLGSSIYASRTGSAGSSPPSETYTYTSQTSGTASNSYSGLYGYTPQMSCTGTHVSFPVIPALLHIEYDELYG